VISRPVHSSKHHWAVTVHQRVCSCCCDPGHACSWCLLGVVLMQFSWDVLLLQTTGGLGSCALMCALVVGVGAAVSRS